MWIGNRFEIQFVLLDGEQRVKLRCPKCGVWGFIDNDQWNGDVSVDCPECEFHETHDFKKLMEESNNN